jgi:hypothetical protein
MVAILVGFLGMFQYLGLSTATIQWSDLNHEQVSALFWTNIALSAAIMLVTIAAAPFAAWFYKEPRLIGITIGYAVSILITGLYIQHEAILIRQMRFAITAVIEVSAMAIGLSVAIVSAIYGARFWALVINQLVLATVSVIGMWAACRWRPGLPRRGADVRSMLTFGGNVTGFNVMQYFARNADNALIGKFWGANELGLYSRAYQMLLMPMQQINAPLAAEAVPRGLSKDSGEAGHDYHAVVRIHDRYVRLARALPAGAAMDKYRHDLHAARNRGDHPARYENSMVAVFNPGAFAGLVSLGRHQRCDCGWFDRRRITVGRKRSCRNLRHH